MNKENKLSFAAIDVKPKWKNWYDPDYDTWNVIYPYFTDTIEEDEDMSLEDFDPMMNYYYPLPDHRDYTGEDARKMEGLPITLVEVKEDDDWIMALALTGGGMDLSWEICEAFMALGFSPPIHFCRLPNMAGYREQKGNFEKIIDACIESIKVKKRNLDFMIKDLEMLKQ